MRLEKYPMKHNGMYVLKKDDFEDIAEMILSEYMPFALNYPQAIDVEFLAQECLYLDIKHVSIMPDGKILGMIAFAEAQFDTVDIYGTPQSIEIEEGTILIDMSLIGPKNRPRKRFTVTQELSHWICHRSYHSPCNQQYNFRWNRNVIACRAESIEQYRKPGGGARVSDEYWEEWQADKLAAALLMPKKTFEEACTAVLRECGIRRGYLVPGVDNRVAKNVMREVSRTFDVSYRAAQIRMINLGFIRV